MRYCWCVQYHSTDFDGNVYCEHPCHVGEIDPNAAWRLLVFAEVAEVLQGLLMPSPVVAPTRRGKALQLVRAALKRRILIKNAPASEKPIGRVSAAS